MLMVGLLCLFVFYPVLLYFRNNVRNLATDGKIRINATDTCSVCPLSFPYVFYRFNNTVLFIPRRFQMLN
jgi:hypothetical protein